MKILTAQQMRDVDRLSTERFGIRSLDLMERAGRAVANAVEAPQDGRIAVLCGRGNNGGDGFVAARLLRERGFQPDVFLFGSGEDLQGDARTNFERLRNTVITIRSAAELQSHSEHIRTADVVIDALLGTGCSKPVTGLLADAIEIVNHRSPQTQAVAVDLPSGLPTDRSDPIGPFVRADSTVTFSALKPCLVLTPNAEAAGRVAVADIGNPEDLLQAPEHKLDTIEPCRPPQRDPDTNKGDYGKVLILAGSRGRVGAAILAGRAALRAGAGLVTVATPQSVAAAVVQGMPELMTESMPETPEGTLAFEDMAIRGALNGKTVLGIGPGLSTVPETASCVRETIRTASIPTVIDADALNAYAGCADLLDGRGRRIVITPHPGEMARLMNTTVEDIQRNRLDAARRFAEEHAITVVLKGHRTIVAFPEGTARINLTGNPGMATAGTGDVLLGLMTGIAGQPHLGRFEERVSLAVYLHGLAGDLAAEAIGEQALVASDLLKFLPAAWKQLRS